MPEFCVNFPNQSRRTDIAIARLLPYCGTELIVDSVIVAQKIGDTGLLDSLTSEDFAPRVGETFEASLDGTPVALTLVKVDVMDERYSAPGARLSFSLTFQGPADPLLPQGSYALKNKTMGTLELFAVPLGPEGDGLSYQIVFN